jgi:hypothetical protein
MIAQSATFVRKGSEVTGIPRFCLADSPDGTLTEVGREP